MATSKFQTQKPFSVLLIISITSFLFLFTKVNSSEVLSFAITNFWTSRKNLILQDEALVTSNGTLQLTLVKNNKPVRGSIGRALYETPIRIWDRDTGNVASFVTSFSFVINAPDPTFTADGLAFFLAHVDDQPKRGGGFLGLFSDKNYDESNQIVAIEFDTFSNQQWDPNYAHIGIDVNTIKSNETASWGFKNGDVANVLISYQASSKTLVASLVYPSGETSYIVSAAVDLKEILPEYVRVGFSATTGLSDKYVETHDILSWSFESKLPADSNYGVGENDIDLPSFILSNSVDLRTN